MRLEIVAAAAARHRRDAARWRCTRKPRGSLVRICARHDAAAEGQVALVYLWPPDWPPDFAIPRNAPPAENTSPLDAASHRRGCDLRADLRPGDVLFIPEGWWHYVVTPVTSVSKLGQLLWFRSKPAVLRLGGGSSCAFVSRAWRWRARR